ncbi:FAD binding domain-containing protein [Coprinopsis sp. MPI-PUGE-AT-0042]|nr:FAD binding domain-containing protein [Coprinopsis sp. MPI-PUGE-AT-0042]
MRFRANCFALLSAWFFLVEVQAQRQQCRCLYGQRCWPSADAFNALSTQLSQPLIRPVPPALPCYSGDPESSQACSEVRARYDNGTWRSGLPGAMQNVNFEAYIDPNGTVAACYLDTTLQAPCDQGSIPPVGVDARTPEDVQAAVKFAKQHRLKLVVKNTGHDYLGRSTAKGSFLVWVHHMKDISLHDAFIPVGGPNKEKQAAITLGAGVQWIEAYTAAHQAGRMVVGGVSAGGSVGAAGGWVMGGGHSANSAAYGLGVDNVLQFTVVTSDGKHVVANAYTNPSLFWALRGGGGGTFGIVTSATYKTYPVQPVSAVFLIANFSSPAVTEDVVTEYVRLHPSIAEKGWGGYSTLTSNHLQFFYISAKSTLEEANASFGPFFQTVLEKTNGTGLNFTVTYPSFYNWYIDIINNNTGQVGGRVEISSRLLSTDIAKRKPRDVAKTMVSLIEGGKTSSVSWNFVAGGAVSRQDPESTGLNPSWRKAVAEVYIVEGWKDGTPSSEIQRLRQRLVEGTKALDTFSVNSAAYLNEAMLHEPDFRKSFFGSHYPRLKKIKREVDPEGLFVVPLGVGSEDWDKDLICPAPRRNED